MEEEANARQRHNKQWCNNGGTVGPCRGYILVIETQLSQSRVEWKLSLEAGSLRQTEAENIAWRRCGSPQCCKSLHSNAESCGETDTSLQGCEPGSTDTKGSTVFGVLPGNNPWRHTRVRRPRVRCSELQSMWISDSAIVCIIMSLKSLKKSITNPQPICSHAVHDSMVQNFAKGKYWQSITTYDTRKCRSSAICVFQMNDVHYLEGR